VTALDETLGYALIPARPGLDVVIDHCPARVRERARLYRPLPEHLQHGLRGRVLGLVLGCADDHGVPDKFSPRITEEVLESFGCRRLNA
jgi:hypothetical protein